MLKRIAIVAALAGALAACAPVDDAAKTESSGGANATHAQPATGRVVSTATPAGLPTFLWAGATTSSKSRPPSSAEEAARAHITSFSSYYRLPADQVSALELRDMHDTGRGAIIARFTRRIAGIEVFGEQIAVAMDRNLDAVALTGFVSGDIPAVAKLAGARLAAAFKLQPGQALRSAASDLAGVTVDAADLEPAIPAAGGYQTIRLRGAAKLAVSGATDPARIKSVFFRAPEQSLLPAYYVEVDLGPDPEGEPRYFAYVVSAESGKVLWKHNLTAFEDNPYSYRVYADDSGLFTPWDGPQGTSPTPHPTGLLDKFQAPFLPANLVTISSLQAVGVSDPWLPPGATETLGNNAEAYLDIALPDGFTPGLDFRGQVSAPGVFDHVFDTSVDANASTTQQLAAATQLFYNVNWFHDWYYAAGFNEQAGNAQFSNYGRGGVEGDGLRAEAQDVSGKNNANMSTPADGARPRMQMYLWDYGAQTVTVGAPSSLAGTYSAGSATFGPTNFSASAGILRANPVNGCTALLGSYTGSIVLIDRGGTNCGASAFATKVQNAQAAGAIAVIIANLATSVNPTIAPPMGGTPSVPITIGVLSLNLADGNRLRASLDAGDTVTGSVTRSTLLRDGDIDNQIVAHEWGHYISNRLIFNASGLDTNMAGGLGEGWADFHAMLITVRPEDTENPTNASWNGVYALGGYALGSFTSDPYYYGVRRFPYSTDMTKDPLTFKHISDAGVLPADVPHAFDGAHAEPHNTGEIWATMLWECYASLLRDTLGPSPRLTFAAARDRMRDYLVAAYKITPAHPTLLDARDALMAAALVNDPIDHQHFAAAFAKRGAGVFAVAPDRFNQLNDPVVESYSTGAAVVATTATLVDDVVAVCNADGFLDNGETGTLRVGFRNVGDAATGALTATASTTTAGVTFPDGPIITIPVIPIGGSAEGTIRVAASGLSGITALDFSVQVADAGAGAPLPAPYGFLGNVDEAPSQSFTDTAESSHIAWSVVASPTDVPDSSRWQRVALSPTEHLYRCPSAEVPATVDFISPPLSVTEGQSLTLSFRHRFSFEASAGGSYEGGVIEISSDNGATWTDVGQARAGYNGTLFVGSGNPLGGRAAYVATSAGYPAFTTTSLDLGAGFGGGVVLIRFRVASDDGVTSPGWDIDDIAVSGVSSPPFYALMPQASCNSQPVAVVGPDQSVPELGPGPAYDPTIVTLDGSASFDSDGNTITYFWTQLAGPAVSLSDPTSPQPTFTAPPITGSTPASLTFQLVVSDGVAASEPKQTTVTVVNVNRAPIASAGPNQTVTERTRVTLNGTGGSDPDGDALSYLWTAPAGITLNSTTAASPTFTAPSVGTAGQTLSFSLVVVDAAGASSAPAAVTVRVNNRGRRGTSVVVAE